MLALNILYFAGVNETLNPNIWTRTSIMYTTSSSPGRGPGIIHIELIILYQYDAFGGVQFKSEPCSFENLVGWSLRRVGKRGDKFELCAPTNDTAYKFRIARDYDASRVPNETDELQRWLDALRMLNLLF